MDRIHRPGWLTTAPRLHTLLTVIALLVIMGVGAYFRTLNLRDWDGGTGNHPDERYIQYTVVGLQLPTDWRDYFRSTCPDPLPAPRNPGAPIDKLEPSTGSGCSTLNPRNFEWSRNFQYGSLPLIATRAVVEWLDRTDPQQIVVTARALGALADTITILTIFLLGCLLYDRRVGLLGAALYACAVMPIQQAHYFTADSWAVCFGALALLFITRMAVRGGMLNAMFSGIFIGAAMASKINMASLALLVPIAVAQVAARGWSLKAGSWRSDHAALRHRAVRSLVLLGLAGLATLGAFRLLQPDAFTGPHIWNIALEPRFLETTREARLTADGTRDLPYLIQWAGRARWLFGWQNMVLWGMGAALGIAAWLGWAAVGWQMIARRSVAALVPFVWVLGYFGWIGAQLLMTMRYFLPIYPPLTLFAAWGLVQVVGVGRWRLPSRITQYAPLLPLLVLGATFAWAWAYTRVYTRPYTRVAAAEWLREQAPDGATTTFEIWDDPLPLNDPRYKQIPTDPYAPEEPGKYLRSADNIDQAGLINQLAQAEYVVLASPRVYDSVRRMPQRYPTITRYYQALFDGSLGYELAAQFQSFPSIGTLRIDDTRAEEAFWVYDHPPVLIFRRTEAFNPEQAYQLIAGDVAWNEVYHGLRPSQVNGAPTALQLTTGAWQRWTSVGPPVWTSDRLGTVGSLAAWLLAVEALGLAACGLVWRLRPRLLDRGLGLARMLGLALFALPPALLGATQLISINQLLLAFWFATLVLAGAVLLWRDRTAIGAFIQRRRWSLVVPHLIYVDMLAVGLLLAYLIDPGARAASVARWTALVRTPTLPPPDLFFAGGHDPLPYAAQLPFAFVGKLLGMMLATGLHLALATALALAVTALWSAIAALVGRFRIGYMWPALAIVLIALPGIVLSEAPVFNLWLALVRADLDTLGLVALAATALALSVRGGRGNLAVQLLLLALVRGYGLPVMLALWLAILAIRWTTTRGDLRRMAQFGAVLLIGALLVGQPFAWSVAPLVSQAMPPLSTITGTLLSLLVPIASLMLYVIAFPRSPRNRHGRAIWSACAIALVLLLIVGPVLTTRLRTDQQHLVTVAGVLLIVAAGWAIAGLLVIDRRLNMLQRRLVVIVPVALVAIAALSTTALSVRAEASSIGSSDAAVNQAQQRVAQNIPNASVLIAAPEAAADWSAAIGSQALIAAPERERRLRAWLEPAISGVIDGRLQAIEAIYGPDATAARQALETYHVSHVILGPSERAIFPAADTTLQALAQENTVGQIFDQDGVTIYRHVARDRTPPFVTRPVELHVPAAPASQLDQPVATLPVVNEYAWNRLANDAPLVGVALWLLVIEIVGLLAFPVVRRVFRRWHDQGWGFSKIVGLLVWGYLVWLPVSLGLWTFTRWSLVWSALALLILNWGLWIEDRRRTKNRAPRTWNLEPRTRRAILRSELCFLIAFAVWTLVRAANPDLWHPIYGGEKPFEFGFLNAILRSPVMPPYEPFFSDGVINYYYYGLFLIALPIKATGIDPAIGFNLAIALLFGLVATAALALGREISGRWRWGLLAIFFMVGMGPLASIFAVGEGRGLEPVLQALDEGLAGFGARLGAWFWGPSRIITSPGYTINEFPLFAFLFADLHPHLIMLPVTLVAIACAIELGRRRPDLLLGVLGALVLGTLAAANSWDAPTYALVIGGALVGRTWLRVRGRLPLRHCIARLGVAAALAIGMLAGGVALYWPFFSRYQAMVGGIGWVQQGDRVIDWLLWFGPLLFLAFSLVGVLLWRAAQRTHVRWRWIARLTAIVIPLLPVVLLLGGWIGLQGDDGLALKFLLGVLGGTAIGMALSLRLRLRDWLPLWLVAVALLVALGVQLVFIRDHLAGGSAQRMNTVFKFGFQIWTLLAIGGATALPLIGRQMRRYETPYGTWLGMLGLLLLPGLLYPLAGIPSRLSTRFDTAQPLTLDGLAFMQRGEYTHRDQTISLQPDAEAIAWLNQNITGTPVFLTSEAEFYRAYGMRIAANTGLPTVLGRLHQDEQRDPATVAERERDVQTLFNTTDPVLTQQLLRRYRVDYVYIGPIERVLYAPEGIAKWEQLEGTLLDQVYQNDGVTIYRVNHDAIQVTHTDLPPIVEADTETMTLETALAIDPTNSDAAFALGQHYLERDRAAEAVQVMELAIRAHPDDVPLHHLWGDALLRAGRADEAIAAWQHTVDIDRTPNNLTKLGRELLLLERYDQAERILSDAIVLDPYFGEALFNLGEVYRRRDAPSDHERAIAQYQLCLERVPSDSPWHAEAARALEELGEGR